MKSENVGAPPPHPSRVKPPLPPCLLRFLYKIGGKTLFGGAGGLPPTFSDFIIQISDFPRGCGGEAPTFSDFIIQISDLYFASRFYLPPKLVHKGFLVGI